MNTIYITGITGFVGANLSTYLNSDYTIKGISRKANEYNIPYKKLTKHLLDDSRALIHLAGKAHDLKKTSEDKEYFDVNTELTKKLFDQFLDSNCEVFIYMSSVKAAADEVDGILDENYNSNPVTVYGKSKLAAEEYIQSKELPESKRVYILRPCMIHGPNNKGNLNLLYSFVSKGIPYPFGSYENERSFLSVENLCFVIRELINNEIKSGIYNVADDEPLSTKDLVSSIGESINKKVTILNIPKGVINIIAKLGDVLPFPINSERVQKLTENYVVSNSKIKEALNTELPLNVKEGINITVKSFNN